MVAWDNQSSSNGQWSADQPLTTITSKARHGIVQPFLIELRGTDPVQVEGSAKSVDSPVGTITAGGGHHALVEPFIVGDGKLGLIEAQILPQQSDGRLRPVSEPMPTVSTSGAIAMVEPFVVKFYGTGTTGPINEPLGTVTTKDRFGLLCPVVCIDGQIARIRLRWRMFKKHELAAAQSFPPDYQFTGTGEEIVKQIGNAVPPAFMEALVGAQLDAGNL